MTDQIFEFGTLVFAKRRVQSTNGHLIIEEATACIVDQQFDDEGGVYLNLRGKMGAYPKDAFELPNGNV